MKSNEQKQTLTHTLTNISTTLRHAVFCFACTKYRFIRWQPWAIVFHSIPLLFILSFNFLLLMNFIFDAFHSLGNSFFSFDGNDVVCECAMRALSCHQIFTHCSLASNLLTADCIFDVIVWFVVVLSGCSILGERTHTDERKCGEKICVRCDREQSSCSLRRWIRFVFRLLRFFFFLLISILLSRYPIPCSGFRVSDFSSCTLRDLNAGRRMCFKRTSEVDMLSRTMQSKDSPRSGNTPKHTAHGTLVAV